MPPRNARNPPYLLLPRGIEFIAGKNNQGRLARESVSVVRISLQRFRDFGTNLPYGFFGMSVSRKGVGVALVSRRIVSLDVSVWRLGPGEKLRQRFAGGRNLIHNNNATRLKERFTFQTQWQPRVWGSHSPSKQREGSGVPLKILMSCAMVEFVKEQASERVSQLRG